MQVTKKNLSDTKVQLKLTADAATLTHVKQETLEHLAHDMKLPGFRPGKAPLNIVEKNANPSLLQTEFLDRAMNHLYAAALEQENLRPVSQPEVKIEKFVPYDTLEMTVEVQVVGAVKLPDYKKMKFDKKPVKITAKDVDEVIRQLKLREAEKKDVDREVRQGDQAWIDFSGVDAKTKEPIQGADGKEYPLAIGSGTFIPGFEENIVGLKAGESKEFTIQFPADYGVKALQKRNVTFTVTVTKVQEVTEPKIDDAFAAKVGPFKTAEELKEDIKKQLASEKEYQADREFVDQIITKITEQAEVAIPEVLVDEQVERLERDQRQNLVYRGQTWQEYLEAEGVNEEEYRTKLRPDAELRVKAGLVLAEIAEAEKITVTPEELEMQLQMYKAQYPDQKMQAELDKPEARREIASRMMSEKTLAKLADYAAKK